MNQDRSTQTIPSSGYSIVSEYAWKTKYFISCEAIFGKHDGRSSGLDIITDFCLPKHIAQWLRIAHKNRLHHHGSRTARDSHPKFPIIALLGFHQRTPTYYYATGLILAYLMNESQHASNSASNDIEDDGPNKLKKRVGAFLMSIIV